MAVRKNYLTNGELIEEIKISKTKHRESNVERTEAECLTPRLANCFLILVKRYSQKRNWASYTYLEDMQSEALVTLCQHAFKFDETKYNNAFAYYTSIIHNSFLSYLEKEARLRRIKDDLFEMYSLSPSFHRQQQNHEQQKD